MSENERPCFNPGPALSRPSGDADLAVCTERAVDVVGDYGHSSGIY